jgi:hypothetical protein
MCANNKDGVKHEGHIAPVPNASGRCGVVIASASSARILLPCPESPSSPHTHVYLRRQSILRG